jgi:RecQ zinc-binding
VEEYYQQIGRAGRDGLPARCVLYTNDSDFDAYMSEYYIGKLVGNARKAVLDSLQALRNYAASADRCRRQEILHFFSQTVAPCGICDVCQTLKKHGSLTRDYGDVARVLLDAIRSLDQPSASNLLIVATGGVLPHERQYSRQSGGPLVVQSKIQRRRESINGSYTQALYKELLGLLKEKGYVSSSTASATIKGFIRTWSVHALTAQGNKALLDESSPIILPVPQGVREAEQIKEERCQKQLAYLDQKGIPKSRIPQEEIEQGDGPVMQAYNKWYSYLEIQTKNQKPIDHLERLVRIIESWRSAIAVALRLAPVSVLAEHLVASIAYVTATSTVAIDEGTLATIGVRVKERSLLVAQLAAWHGGNRQSLVVSNTAPQGCARLVVREINPSKPWQFAVYKKVKKTGMATWEASYQRFVNGESPQAIAMSQPSGKPIQAATVVGHILDALTHGRRIADASMLGQFCVPPTRPQWERLQEAEAVTKIDVCGNPADFTMTELLRPVVGDSLVDTPFASRSDEQKAELNKWYDALKWYMALRRSDTAPVFQDDK